MAYALPTWEYATDPHLLKLQRLQNRVLRAVGNLNRCTPVRELHVASKISYVCGHVTELCSSQTEVTLNYLNQDVLGIGQGQLGHRKYKRLKQPGKTVLEKPAGI
jgi:hypothetical protein